MLQTRRLTKKRRKRRNAKGTTIALTVIAVLDVLFIIAMIWLFYLYQSVPDSLIVAVFGTTFGECGFCTLIYKIKKGIVKEEDNALHGSDIPEHTETVCSGRYEEL